MKYLAGMGGSLMAQGVISLFVDIEVTIALFLICLGTWITLEGFALGRNDDE